MGFGMRGGRFLLFGGGKLGVLICGASRRRLLLGRSLFGISGFGCCRGRLGEILGLGRRGRRGLRVWWTWKGA